MNIAGGCYCGAVRYEATGAPSFKAQCHCRECQYITGGGPNYFLMMPAEGFRYTKGTPSGYARSDLDNPYTREFCPICGTHMVTRRADLPAVVVKVGTLDDPKLFEVAQMAIYTIDKQPFHVVPEGMPAFERLPGR